MTPEEAVALLLDIARKGMFIDAQAARIRELEAELAALKGEPGTSP